MDKPILRERVEHVLKAIRTIQEYISQSSEHEFQLDRKLQDAILFQFLIIGEAIRHIDNTILSKYNYPWHIPRSFRNFILHEYHGIKMTRVYHACYDLEPLEEVLEAILVNEFDSK